MYLLQMRDIIDFYGLLLWMLHAAVVNAGWPLKVLLLLLIRKNYDCLSTSSWLRLLYVPFTVHTN